MTVDLASALANALFVLDRPMEGAEALRAVEPRLLTLNDRQREIEHYANLGVLLDAANRHVEAQPALRHVLALTRAHGDRTSEMMTSQPRQAVRLGQVPVALETLQTAYRLKEAYPELRTSSLFLEAQLGNAHRALGRYAEALEWQQRALPILAEYVPAFVAAAHNGLARIWLDLGQFARARQHLQQALERRPVPAWSQATSHLLFARLAFEQSQGDAAAKAIALAEAIGATRFPVRAQARLLAGRLQSAEAAYLGATEVALEAAGCRCTVSAWTHSPLPRDGRLPAASRCSPRRTRSKRCPSTRSTAPTASTSATSGSPPSSASMPPATRGPARCSRQRWRGSGRPRVSTSPTSSATRS